MVISMVYKIRTMTFRFLTGTGWEQNPYVESKFCHPAGLSPNGEIIEIIFIVYTNEIQTNTIVFRPKIIRRKK